MGTFGREAGEDSIIFSKPFASGYDASGYEMIGVRGFAPRGAPPLGSARSLFCHSAWGILSLTAAFSLLPLSARGQSTVADLWNAPEAALQQTPHGQTESPPASSSSSTQPAQETEKEAQQRAEREVKEEEKQRVFGVIPAFESTSNRNAAPLSSRQKFQLDLHSSLDPFVFIFTGVDAGEEQAENTFPGYGQGAEGYAKRYGASFTDTFDGDLWGNAILPSLLHQDPRYFRMGSGSFLHRALYAVWTTVWCRRDNGRWRMSYATVAGDFIAGGISNLYYPAGDRGFSLTVTRALTVTAEGAIGSELVEFWPDVSKRLFEKRKHPVTL
jgi:hypothetical protein